MRLRLIAPADRAEVENRHGLNFDARGASLADLARAAAEASEPPGQWRPCAARGRSDAGHARQTGCGWFYHDQKHLLPPVADATGRRGLAESRKTGMKYHLLTLGGPFFGVSLIERAASSQIGKPAIVLNIGTEAVTGNPAAPPRPRPS